MKSTRLIELRALLAHPDFQGWWTQLQNARIGLQTARHQYDELLSQTSLMEFRAELTQKNAIDTLYRAGELEDSAARLLAEAQELENRSLLRVAEFEEQRFRVSELWYRLGAAEKALEDRREDPRAQKTHRLAAEEYERESTRKNQLWDEVEALWAQSAEVSLQVSEQRFRGRKIRKEAEQLFALAEERKQRSKALRAEAEAAAQAVEAAERNLQRLMNEARERFGCSTGAEFLYFRVRENAKLAWAVSLVDDQENFNVEVKPLAVYAVERQRGVAFLEPARAEAMSVEEGDRRFEEYFLSGRKGEIRSISA